jgi:hypothetical protein
MSMKVVRLVGTIKFFHITLAAIIFCLGMSGMSINDDVMIVGQNNLNFCTLDSLVVRNKTKWAI